MVLLIDFISTFAAGTFAVCRFFSVIATVWTFSVTDCIECLVRLVTVSKMICEASVEDEICSPFRNGRLVAERSPSKTVFFTEFPEKDENIACKS